MCESFSRACQDSDSAPKSMAMLLEDFFVYTLEEVAVAVASKTGRQRVCRSRSLQSLRCISGHNAIVI